MAALPVDLEKLRQRMGRARQRRAHGRSIGLGVRTHLAPSGAHGARLRLASDRRVVEPDRCRGRGAHLASASRQDRIPKRCTDLLAPAPRVTTSRGDSKFTFEPDDAVPAWSCEPTGWAFDAAERALAAGFGEDAVFMGVGGTIPFVGPFVEAFGGIPALLLGPADPDSHIHGEDESLHLGDWRHLMARAKRTCSPRSPRNFARLANGRSVRQGRRADS